MAFVQRKRYADLPVLAQEMRIRQRGVRPFVVSLVYVLALSIISVAYISMNSASGVSDPTRLSEMGKDLFVILAWAQLIMISLLVPAYSSSVVSSEREKGTFELLVLTMLSSGAIVRQKLSAAIAEVVMLTLTSLPVLGLVFLLGGVTPWQLAQAYILLLTTSLLMGSFGVLCSCAFAKTRVATTIAYLGMFSFVLLLPLGAEWLRSVSREGLMESASTLPFALVGLLVFIGGLGALALFSVAASLLKRRVKWWDVRAFRMGVFGACYSVVLLIIGVPSLADMVVGVLYGVDRNLSLPMFVNPFIALTALADQLPGSTMNGVVIISTMLFAILCTYLFLNLSVRRLRALRRS